MSIRMQPNEKNPLNESYRKSFTLLHSHSSESGIRDTKIETTRRRRHSLLIFLARFCAAHCEINNRSRANEEKEEEEEIAYYYYHL